MFTGIAQEMQKGSGQWSVVSGQWPVISWGNFRSLRFAGQPEAAVST
jgi:hypothetical protein